MSEIDVSEMGDPARRLVEDVLAGFDLSPAELAMLESAAHLLDRRDALQTIVDRDGLMTAAYGGRLHPAAIEGRQTALALTRVLTALNVPLADDAA